MPILGLLALLSVSVISVLVSRLLASPSTSALYVPVLGLSAPPFAFTIFVAVLGLSAKFLIFYCKSQPKYQPKSFTSSKELINIASYLLFRLFYQLYLPPLYHPN